MSSEDHDEHVAAYWSAKKQYFTRDLQEQLIRAERNALAEGRMARRGADPTFPWTGLALSGGGIRSATFSLGVLQALARNDLLKHFDFISSVSGGGYIGASLQWWWSQGQGGVGPNSFPYGPGSVGANQTPPFANKQQQSRLSFLRSHGKYLIPGQDINIWSGLAVVIRTVLLSVLVWVPLLTLLSFLILLADFCLVEPKIKDMLDQPQATRHAISSPFAGLVAEPEPPPAQAPAQTNPSRTGPAPAAKAIEAAKQDGDSAAQDGTAPKDGGTAAALNTKAANDKTEGPPKAAVEALPAGSTEVAKQKSDGAKDGKAARDGATAAAVNAKAPDDKAKELRKALTEAFALRSSFALLHWLVLLGAALFALFALVFALLSGAADKPSPKGIGFWLLLLIGVACVAFSAFRISSKELAEQRDMDWVVIVLFSTIGITIVGRSAMNSFGWGQQLLTSVQERGASGSYSLRRSLERQFGRWFLRWVILAVLGAVPLLPLYAISASDGKLSSSWHVFGALFSVLSGALSALYGYYLKLKNTKPSLAGQIFAPAGAAVFLLGTMAMAYSLSIFALAALTTDAPSLGNWLGEAKSLLQLSLLPTLILAIMVGTMANINHVGLHRFYRDRLMELFMPTSAAVTQNRVSASPKADLLNVSDLAGEAGQSPSLGAVPYPLINAFAFLTDKDDGRVELRGGDNVLISPLYVGSRVTGWRKTNDYCEIHGPLTLASAMAVSGAAVNSNAGYIGTGITRDSLVSAVMTILNMRLGVWIGNPMRARPGFRRTPTFLFPMLTSGLFRTPKEDSRFVEVSDGGNFENLGIYELIRRRVCLILVVDGEADPTLAFPALVSAINRVKEDFGATIRLSNLQGPDQLLPSAALTGYPEGAKFAKSPFMIGDITYEDSTKGVLIYIKATLIKELDFTTYGYRAGSADFPHEGTEDQFFSEAQFEAYRNLGFVCAERMITGTRMADWIGSGENPPVQVAGL